MKYEYRYQTVKSIHYTLLEHDIKAAVIRHIKTTAPTSLPSNMLGKWTVTFYDDGSTLVEAVYEFKE